MSKLERAVRNSGHSFAESLPDMPEVEVRLLTTLDEFRACVDFQRRIWGGGYADVVAASVLQATGKVGSIVGGAFLAGDEAMVGFVLGFTGLKDGRPTHWSHMLGVLPEHRGRGIGERLKLKQRQWVLERGVEEMRWTFDPLIAGNAHFNLNSLGVEIEAYAQDMYGDTGSTLHTFGTDRFIAYWRLREEEAPRAMAHSIEDAGESPVLNPGGDKPSDPIHRVMEGAPPLVRIAIPNDIVTVNRNDPSESLRWRASTRAAFQEAMGAGYRVSAFYREAEAGESFYVLGRH